MVIDNVIGWAAGAVTAVVTVISFWMTLSSRITKAQESAKAAENRATSAEIMANAAIAKCELLARDFNMEAKDTGSRLSAMDAVLQATTKSLTQAEGRLAKSIDDLGNKMDHLRETITQTLAEVIGRRGQ